MFLTMADLRAADMCRDGLYAFKGRYPAFDIRKFVKGQMTDAELLSISTDEPVLRLIETAKRRLRNG